MPELPKLNYKRIEKDRRSYANLLVGAASHVDATLIRRVKLHVQGLYDSDYADSVAQTLQQYTGDRLTHKLANLLAAQLAARYEQLAGGPLERFNILNVRQEWVPLEIVGMQQAVWRESKPGIQLALDCMAGSPAGHQFDRKLPLNWLSYLAYRIGFSRRMTYPDDQPWLFQRLRFWGLMVKHEDKAELDFVDFSVDNPMKKYNKEILKLRLRYEIDGDVECPFAFEHECSSCLKKPSECIAAPLVALPLHRMSVSP